MYDIHRMPLATVRLGGDGLARRHTYAYTCTYLHVYTGCQWQLTYPTTYIHIYIYICIHDSNNNRETWASQLMDCCETTYIYTYIYTHTHTFTYACVYRMPMATVRLGGDS